MNFGFRGNRLHIWNRRKNNEAYVRVVSGAESGDCVENVKFAGYSRKPRNPKTLKHLLNIGNTSCHHIALGPRTRVPVSCRLIALPLSW